MRAMGSRGLGEVVTYLPMQPMQEQFARALARAVEQGVPVELRADIREYDAQGKTFVVDARTAARNRLEKELHKAQRRKQNAHLSTLDAETDEDRRVFRQDLSRYSHQVQSLTEQLMALDTGGADGHMDSFEAPVAPLLAALATVSSVTRMSPDEAAAFHVLVPHVRMTRESSGAWIAEAAVRLVVADGVAEIGPIRWRAGAAGLGVAGMRDALGARGSDARPTLGDLRHRLDQTGQIGAAAATLLLQCPFPELVHVVLQGLAGEPFPTWVGPQWRQPRFVAHVTSTYVAMGDAPSTRLTRYGKRYARAQAIVDCAADVGELTLERARAVLPGFESEDLRVPTGIDTLQFPFALVTRSVTAGGVQCVVNRTCSCGRIALVVINVPEIPGALLCGCGLAADAEPGSSAHGVRFPDGYVQLRVRRDQWMDVLRQSRGFSTDDRATVTPLQRQVLTQLIARPGSAVTDLVHLLGNGRSAVAFVLAALTRRGFVNRTDDFAPRYTVIDPELAREVMARKLSRAG
jgi:hypothetical protein